MALHPNVQKRAQEEIDRIVGRDRMPTIDDRPSLPYVEALCREVLRWRPSGPLGFPHAAVDDDVYNGYYIPKGTNVFCS
jgi:cytochrome P450